METGSAARDFVRPTVALSMGGACMRAMRHDAVQDSFTSPLSAWCAPSCQLFKVVNESRAIAHNMVTPSAGAAFPLEWFKK